MMAREMKNSGVQWIGDIPSKWDISPVYKYFHDRIFQNLDYEFQRAFKFNYGTLKFKNEEGDLEYYRDTYINYSKIKKDDIIINGLNLNYDFVSQRVAITPENGIITSAYIALRPYGDLEPNYFCYIFKAMDNMKLFHGMGKGIRLTLSFDELKRQRVCVPSVQEQKAIAAFLDSKCGEIDRLLADLDAEVKTLGEYKKSIIAETVTRGLNHSVSMKSSGIPWAETIPLHWKVMKAKYIFKNKKRIAGNNEVNYERLALTMNGVIKRSKEANDGLQPEKFESYQILRNGELVFKLIDLQNISTSRVGLSPYEGIVSPAYIVISPNKEKMLPKFAERYYLILWYQQIFNSLGSDGIRSNLNAKDLLELPIILPPMDEQEKIANYLDKKCAAIEQSIADKLTQIETLKAYKSSLIYEYVTGKKHIAGF